MLVLPELPVTVRMSSLTSAFFGFVVGFAITVRDSAGRRGATWKCWSPSNKERCLRCLPRTPRCAEDEPPRKRSVARGVPEGVFAAVVPDEHQAKGGRDIERWGRPAPMA